MANANARMGEMVISTNPTDELVALGLGSCIALAMIDPEAGVGGLAHVVLPESANGAGPPAKFADTAVPELLAQMRAAGADAARVQTAIAGGASMFDTTQQLDIGARNREAVHDALRTAQLTCHAEQTGGGQGRTVRVSVGAGVVTSHTAGQEPVALLPVNGRTGALGRAA